eukprot:gnl/TRDRNA2_/TRDRNA2_152386_c1_seq1.p1 gnl/TRDRNA2_/TRDRNA2_152386_c1~~gnl/TRDRNA2_/TRDRNA2_152386_c1_seq1.p1  ORF type:complete len:482 (+),score=110.89 gnl/TRDRNA2_/TRDRNA2_152386_c1_seq1:156-1448(+)
MEENTLVLPGLPTAAALQEDASAAAAHDVADGLAGPSSEVVQSCPSPSITTHAPTASESAPAADVVGAPPSLSASAPAESEPSSDADAVQALLPSLGVSALAGCKPSSAAGAVLASPSHGASAPSRSEPAPAAGAVLASPSHGASAPSRSEPAPAAGAVLASPSHSASAPSGSEPTSVGEMPSLGACEPTLVQASLEAEDATAAVPPSLSVSDLAPAVLTDAANVGGPVGQSLPTAAGKRRRAISKMPPVGKENSAGVEEASTSGPRRSLGACSGVDPATPASRPSASSRSGEKAPRPSPSRVEADPAEKRRRTAAPDAPEVRAEDMQRAALGHKLRPQERGQRVVVVGDGWGGGGKKGYEAIVTEADDFTFTVVSTGGDTPWTETHVLKEHCVMLRDQQTPAAAAQKDKGVAVKKPKQAANTSKRRKGK